MICHLGNIAYRVGKQAPVEEAQEALKGHENATNTLQSILLGFTDQRFNSLYA